MRKIFLGTLALFLSITLVPAAATAQGFVGAGLTMPSGDYGDYAKTGWMATAGMRAWQSGDERMSVWGEGFFGSNKHEGDDGDKTNLYGGMGSLSFGLTQGSSTTPYLIGSVGYMIHSYKPGTSGFTSESEGGIMFGGGGGVQVNNFYVEARYLTASIENSTTAFIMFAAGYIF